MKTGVTWLVSLGLALIVGRVGPAFAAGDLIFRADLDGYQEVPTLSTTGGGELVVFLNPKEDEAEYFLSYDGLEGGAVSAAHIHLGRPATNGGVMVFLCGGARPPCPLSGTVSGTIVAADIIGPVGQGIAPGELAEFVAALRSGAAYVNVHTALYPGGEIRGDLR